MTSRTLTLDRPVFRFGTLFHGPPTFWESLTTDEQQASVDRASFRSFGPNNTAWDAIGRVQQHWHDEVLPFAEEICQRDKREIFRDVDWDRRFSLVCFMIGTTSSSAKPTLVIGISDAGIIGRLGSRLRKEERFKRTGFLIKGQNGNLRWKARTKQTARLSTDPRGQARKRTAGSIQPVVPDTSTKKRRTQNVKQPLESKSEGQGWTTPRSRSMSSPPESPLPGEMEIQTDTRSQNLFGKTITIIVPNQSGSKGQGRRISSYTSHATMGAVVKIGGRVFGLTAAHNLSGQFLDFPDTSESIDVDGKGTVNVYDEGFFDLFSDNDDPVLPKVEPKEEIAIAASAYNLNYPRVVYLENSSGSTSITKGFDKLDARTGQDKVRIGEFPGWLRVSPHQNSPAEQYANPDLDWALIPLENDHRFQLANMIDFSKSKVNTVRQSRNPPLGEVLVVSKVTGYRRAHCSGTLALISLPESDTLRRVYTISSKSSSKVHTVDQAGESGAMVIDPVSGDAHGLVIAESENLGLTYIMPIGDIFDDICKKWNVDKVVFPQEAQQSPFSPLSEGAIRLFVLEPGSDSDTIRGTLRYSFPGVGEYDFLSYSWETTWMTQTIDLDGNDFLIPTSLEEALKSLRYRDRPRTFWVDAICIDMSNLSERRRAHSLWPPIVSGAAQVCIWLGTAEEGTELAFLQIQSMLQLDHFEASLGGPLSTKGLVALRSLMKRSFFSRRWVVQEVAYARKAWIHCGPDSADWADFADAVTLLCSAAAHRGLGGNINQLPASRLVVLCKQLFDSRGSGASVPMLPLDSIVCLLADFKASNPRDSIYACLSLAKGTGWPAPPHWQPTNEAAQNFLMFCLESWIAHNRSNALLSDARPAQRRDLLARWVLSRLRSRVKEERNRVRSLKSLVPLSDNKRKKSITRPYEVDYTRSFFDVAEKFVTFAINVSNSLDIICRAWAPISEKVDLPSWIRSLEDAEYGTSRTGEHSRLNGTPLTSLKGLETPRYSAGPPLETTRFPFVAPSGSLHLRGINVDYIKHLGMPALLGNIPWEWLEFADWNSSQKTIPARLWRTLIADRDSAGQRPPLWYGLACEHGLKQVVEGGDINISELANNAQPPYFSEFYQRVQEVVWSRRLMKTASGILGLAPRNSQIGDNICILRGCSVPVILRKRLGSDHWELVGECFVYGMMDGEVSELDLEEQTFVLT